jgi:radical SAM protein with 4Fe4S-binding SPASM domain
MIDGPVYCDIPWWSVYIEVTGEVRPCCDYGLVLGNLTQQGAKAIWDERFATLRQLQQLGTAPAGCGQCCAARIGRVGTEG